MSIGPVGELHPGFSSEDATPTSWAEVSTSLEDADLAWLTTVRPDGRPHMTPVIFAWWDGAVFFVTGLEERKAENLERNPHCLITTGCNTLDEGLDVVVEGEAAAVRDATRLREVAEALAAKYLPREGAKVFHDDLREHTFIVDGKTLLFEVRPTTVFGFGKGEEYRQTRWRF